ncbi:MAG: single-stranded DNA-binding protein [Oscillospiraceae bacterium]|nr:single-stranded DNA-binding protein [Oscillospiraceae bacterium]
MLNRVVLIGRLTQDPELRFTQSGIAVATFTLAVERNFKSANGERETDFIDIVVWRQQAENCANYLSKGKLAAVDGSLRIRSYETKDGQKRKAAEIVADNVRFLSPRDSFGGAPSYQEHMPEPSPFGDSMPGGIMGDDDLPF